MCGVFFVVDTSCDPSVQAVNEVLHPQHPPSFMRAGLVGAIAWAGSVAQKGQSLTAAATSGMTSPAEAAKAQDAVLVFGSTGKLGRLVVQQVWSVTGASDQNYPRVLRVLIQVVVMQHVAITAAVDEYRLCMQLLAAGRDVVAAARSADKAEVFAELEPDNAPGKLFIKTGVDVTDASSLSDELLEGVTQIVSAVGPVSTAAGKHRHRNLIVCALDAVQLHPATPFASGIHQVPRCPCNKHSHARRAYSG